MSDDLERDLARVLHDRVAEMPATHEVAPVTVARVHRRRAVKLGAFATAVLVVIAGTAAAVALADRTDSDHLTTAEPTTVPGTRPSVDTVRCPVTVRGNESPPGPTPIPGSRVPAAGDPRVLAHLVSYAATNDPRYTVLGPKGWRCRTTLVADGGSIVAIDSPDLPDGDASATSPLLIQNSAFGGGVGTPLACSVFSNNGDAVNNTCFTRPGRTVHRIDTQLATFVDTDGAQGAGRLVMPSSPGATDGSISVLTCRPTTGLTADDCDTIIADWVARVRAATATTTTTTTPSVAPGTVATTVCPVTYALTQYRPLPSPSTTPRTVTIPGADAFVSYAATTDDRYIVLGPKGWHCSAAVGADGDNGMDVTANSSPGASSAAISIINDYLWHGFVGVGEACNVFTNPAVVSQASGGPPCSIPPGRTVTSVDAHVSTFRDADGARGVGWVVYPSSPTADDGKLSILTCHPTEGLSAADCDAIVADYVARVRGSG